jgi:hypothetical protein
VYVKSLIVDRPPTVTLAHRRPRVHNDGEVADIRTPKIGTAAWRNLGLLKDRSSTRRQAGGWCHSASIYPLAYEGADRWDRADECPPHTPERPSAGS